MKTHPADGLYYVTCRMLEDNGACYVAADIANHFRAKSIDTEIPITLQRVRWLTRRSGGLYWAASKMRAAKKTTMREDDKFRNAGWERVCEAFMDMLLSRAKREGLVR